MTKHIPLTRGYTALVDDEDYDQLAQHTWHYMPCAGYDYGYAARRSKGKVITMHRVIAQVQPGESVDHANGDTLDNRRSNLRRATTQQNAANRRKPRRTKPTTSQYKGVYWDKLCQKWVAQIRVKTKAIVLGRFTDEMEAAQVYDTAAREHFGPFARTNF